MKELTKAEEQVMQILWDKKKVFVKEILAEMPNPKPAYNTVSTIVRILESKGFVSYDVFGNSHRYYPLIEKDVYRKFTMDQMVKGYFGGSATNLISFFIKEKSLDINDLDEIINTIQSQKGDEK